jgi:hypothetical protein
VRFKKLFELIDKDGHAELVEASLPLRCVGIDYLRSRDASTSGRQMKHDVRMIVD